MKRAIAMMLLLGAVAHADATHPLVKAPDGWKADPEQATALSAKANGLSHFGGARALATANVFTAPEPGAVLFVTAVAAKVAPDARDASARVVIDELGNATQRASLAGSGIVVDSWETKVDPATKEVRGTLQWRDTKAGTQTNARIVIVADAETMVAVTGECLTAAGGPEPLVDACVAALGTLDPGIDPARRVELALAAPGTSPPEPAVPATPPPAKVGGPATMSDATHVPMAPIQVSRPEKPPADRRPVYVGFGIVILAAVFWWNSRRRARFEKDEEADE
jgi:hypothetical protein